MPDAIQTLTEIKDYCQQLQDAGEVDIHQVIERCDYMAATIIEIDGETAPNSNDDGLGMLLDVGLVTKFKIDQILIPDRKITVSMEIANPNDLDFGMIDQFRAAGKNAPIEARFICRQLPMMPLDMAEDQDDTTTNNGDNGGADAIPDGDLVTYKISLVAGGDPIVVSDVSLEDALHNKGLDPEEICGVKRQTGPRSWAKIKDWGQQLTV